MSESARTLTLPRDGYGPEPRTPTDLILLASARVQATLPSGWTVTTTTASGLDRDAGTTLQLMRNTQVVLAFDVEIKRAVNRSAVLEISDRAERLTSDDAPPLVVSRYLTPQVQQELRQRGISYADATGNLFLTSDDPLIMVAERGAAADPWRGPGRPTTSLKGLPAALLVRALVDYAPPYSVPQLADAAGASLGATYRLIDYLTGEGLLTRTERGPITVVDWPELLRRWSDEARYLDTSTSRGFLEPRGLSSLQVNLRELSEDQRYAVSGSLAAQPYASYAEPRLALLYADDPLGLAATLGLRPVDAGANVIVASPRSPVVFDRTSTWQGTTIVAPSQAVADLRNGPGRNPAEGDYLLNWMERNTDEWRHQLDR